MCPCEFEAKIQVDCVLDVVRIIRSGDPIANRNELLKHAGCILGCLGAYFEGTEDPPIYGANDPEVPTSLEACCDAIEQELGGEGMKLGPVAILVIRQLVKLLLEQLL